VGKEGDVVVFKNHPLSIYAIPQYTIVDGITRFDINNDPNDMRVDVDPEQTIPTFFESDTQHHHQGHEHSACSDGCLQGVYDYLFENKE